ncbi:reverse transcriptase [Gossypium australe]|uniref:Reverse transcriptase n=1 Tax=Gossypium australe TaxID=47621 RepID=A0A5B6WZT6_9ROSI|nr:reverse transcriptase [Gossypium australe]
MEQLWESSQQKEDFEGIGICLFKIANDYYHYHQLKYYKQWFNNHLGFLVNNKELISKASEVEVKNDVFQLGGLKAPGSDGYCGIFYQKYWSIVKDGAVRCVQSFFRNGRMLREMNKTEVVLIPKVKGPELVSQLRPISLCNFCYKITARVMVNRIRPLMGELIMWNQSAFIEERLIQDNFVIAGEVFHYLKLRRRGRRHEVDIKLDMRLLLPWQSLFGNKGMGKERFIESWCIVNGSDKLWIRVLKGRYFPNSEFFEAQKGAQASWIWSSLAGREREWRINEYLER